MIVQLKQYIKTYITNSLYKLISIINNIEFKYKYKSKCLIDNYKTISDIDITDYNLEILTDSGYQPISHLYTTKPFIIYRITLEKGYKIDVADKHKFFDENYDIIYADELNPNSFIQTDAGLKRVQSIKIYNNLSVSMADVTVDHPDHRLFTNGILSHNSVITAIFCLWSVLFRTDRNALLLSKSGAAGVDLLGKIKDMYRFLPYHLKPGILKWNQTEISFDNNSSMSTESFSPTAGLGKTINFLVLDEFAWCPPNDVELFYNNIIPTVTTDTTANVCIISTQNGFNLFYKLFTASQKGENIYANMTVNWWDVPNWDGENKCWVKRDEKWKQQTIGVLGSPEEFEYQYGTMFLTSDKCLVPRETLSRLMERAKLFLSLNKHDIYGIKPIDNSTDDSINSIYKLLGKNYTLSNNLYVSLYNKYLYIKEGYEFSKDNWYIILIDLAEGAGKDYTVFNIIEKKSDGKMEQVARWTANTVDLQNAALEFWLLYTQVFNPDRCIFSIEWNTYGALFYTYLMALNESDNNNDENAVLNNWRFQYAPDGIDMGQCVRYTKTSQEDNIAGLVSTHSKTVPGIKMTAANKKTACAMLKNLIIKDDLVLTDLTTISELQNFEDDRGNGSYRASYGHDDIIMTMVQIPLLQNTAKYKDFCEDIELSQSQNNVNSELRSSIDNISSGSWYNF